MPTGLGPGLSCVTWWWVFSFSSAGGATSFPSSRGFSSRSEAFDLGEAVPVGISSPLHCGPLTVVSRKTDQGQNLVNRYPSTHTGFEETPDTRVSLEWLFVPSPVGSSWRTGSACKTSCQVEYDTHAHGSSSSASRTWPEAARSATGLSQGAGGRANFLVAPPHCAGTGSAQHRAGKPAPVDRHTAPWRALPPRRLPPGPCSAPEQQSGPWRWLCWAGRSAGSRHGALRPAHVPGLSAGPGEGPASLITNGCVGRVAIRPAALLRPSGSS